MDDSTTSAGDMAQNHDDDVTKQKRLDRQRALQRQHPHLPCCACGPHPTSLSPDDMDEAYLAFLASRRADAELSLLRIEKKKRTMLCGLAFAQRRSLLQTLLVNPVPSTDSSIFHGIDASSLNRLPTPLPLSSLHAAERDSDNPDAVVRRSNLVKNVSTVDLNRAIDRERDEVKAGGAGLKGFRARFGNKNPSNGLKQEKEDRDEVVRRIMLMTKSDADDASSPLPTAPTMSTHADLPDLYAQVPSVDPLRSRLWAEVLPCVGCGGYIPFDRYAKHALECSVEGNRDLRLATGFSLEPPSLTVCGCPVVIDKAIVDPLLYGPNGTLADPKDKNKEPLPPAETLAPSAIPGVKYCALNREDCVQHLLWDALSKVSSLPSVPPSLSLLFPPSLSLSPLYSCSHVILFFAPFLTFLPVITVSLIIAIPIFRRKLLSFICCIPSV